ncbi:uncharacterized protein LOC119391726 [Rhipicephalus sanguineus]|uniref:uncharacterized protein LOC119391726 n=1 Tax=Rhipicephalus sanguineus TaxID=34632 RepID=UPI0020C28317|nr:uncharacterized protein LOC119391726 [Rhipicephalus sanguineus]
MDNGMFRTCFRFEKEDVPKLRVALRIPETVMTAQRVPIPGDEALCITLRRLAYPNRLKDLENFFGRHSSTISSLTIEVLRHIDEKFFHLLDDVNNHSWLTIDTLENFSKAIYAKGAPLTNCWGFIDGTARAICRPTRQQQLYFSGHKRFHALKYQSIMCPNGIICQLDGCYPGSKHDAGNFGNSQACTKLEKLVQGHHYCLYGDPAYPLRPLLLKPYGGASLTPEQCAFNKAMSSVRQAVEWGFGKITGLFAVVDFKKKNQKIFRQNVARMYKASALLANCHTCLYGAQVSQYFDLQPPSLEVYLNAR